MVILCLWEVNNSGKKAERHVAWIKSNALYANLFDGENKNVIKKEKNVIR